MPTRTDAFRDKLFLAICIAYSVYIGISVFSFKPSVIGILVVIGAWITYASARRNDSPLQGGGLSLVYGSLKATYIINWILVGLLGMLSLICLIALGFVDSVADIGERIEEAAESSRIVYAIGQLFEFSIEFILVLSLFVCIVTAVAIVILNVFYYKKLYQAADNIRGSLLSTAPVRHIRALRVWFIVLAVFGALDVISFSPLTFISSACSVVMYILLFIWAGKYFDDRSSNYAYSQSQDNANGFY